MAEPLLRSSRGGAGGGEDYPLERHAVERMRGFLAWKPVLVSALCLYLCALCVAVILEVSVFQGLKDGQCGHTSLLLSNCTRTVLFVIPPAILLLVFTALWLQRQKPLSMRALSFRWQWCWSKGPARDDHFDDEEEEFDHEDEERRAAGQQEMLPPPLLRPRFHTSWSAAAGATGTRHARATTVHGYDVPGAPGSDDDDGKSEEARRVERERERMRMAAGWTPVKLSVARTVQLACWMVVAADASYYARYVSRQNPTRFVNVLAVSVRLTAVLVAGAVALLCARKGLRYPSFLRFFWAAYAVFMMVDVSRVLDPGQFGSTDASLSLFVASTLASSVYALLLIYGASSPSVECHWLVTLQLDALRKGREKRRPDWPPLSEMWSFVRPERGYVAAGFFFSLLRSGAFMALQLETGNFVSGHASGQGTAAIARGIQLFAAFAIGFILFQSVSAYCFLAVNARLTHRVKSRVLAHAMVLPPSYAEEHPPADLQDVMFSQTEAWTQALTVSLPSVAGSVIDILVGMGVLWYVSWQLSVVLLCLLAVLNVIIAVRGHLIKPMARRKAAASNDLAKLSYDIISNLPLIRMSGQEKFEQFHLDASQEQVVRHKMGLVLWDNSVGGGVERLAMYVVLAVGLYYSALLALDGDITAGELAAYTLISLTIRNAFRTVMAQIPRIQNSAGNAGRVFDFLAVEPQSFDGKDPGELKGGIELDGVSFSYPGSEAGRQLDGVSVSAAPGDSLVFVGRSGCGKSTVLKLVQGVYPVREGMGSVRLDGHDLRDLRLDRVWRQVGVVTQAQSLFRRSVLYNIAYAVPAERKIAACTLPNGDVDYERLFSERFLLDVVDEQRVRHVIDMCSCADFIQRYDDLSRTPQKLSGGQVQRLCLARTLYGRPKVLLLDEVTSALDPESEQHVTQSIARVQRTGVTCLAVTHRLHTAQAATGIAVMHAGRVAEFGTHASLMARNRRYARMYRAAYAADGGEADADEVVSD